MCIIFILMFQGKIEASEVVQSLKILGIDISEKQAEKILQRLGIIIFWGSLIFFVLLIFIFFCFRKGDKWDMTLKGVGIYYWGIWFWEENVTWFLCRYCW